MRVELKSWENIPLGGAVAKDITTLIKLNPQIEHQPAVVCLINWTAGFGSAMTVFIHNWIYLERLNPKLVVLPHFSSNSINGFKYHDPSNNNSFFCYFAKRDAAEVAGLPIYFCNCSLIKDESLPFFNWHILPPMSEPANQNYIEKFYKHYRLRIDNSRVQQVIALARARGKLIGLHLRSYARQVRHNPTHCKVSMADRLNKLANNLRDLGNYQLFVATDVEAYLTLAKQIFGERVHHLSVHRGQTEKRDPTLDWAKFTGLELGYEVLADAYGLSQCDVAYVSPSNVAILVNLINPRAELLEF